MDLLTEKEKEWLNSFVEETIITNFQHKGKKFYKTKKAKREFYNSNNARNRCMFTKAKTMGTLFSTDSLPSLDLLFAKDAGVDNSNDVEDAMIAALELKRSGIIEQELDEADKNLESHLKLMKLALDMENAKFSKRKKKARNTC